VGLAGLAKWGERGVHLHNPLREGARTQIGPGDGGEHWRKKEGGQGGGEHAYFSRPSVRTTLCAPSTFLSVSMWEGGGGDTCGEMGEGRGNQ